MRRMLICAGVFAAVLMVLDCAKADDFYAYYTRLVPNRDNVLAYEDQISGKWADVVVKLGENNRLVFSRKTSYLPYWETNTGRWSLDEIVKRSGDGEDDWPDVINRYSHVRIIENAPTRVVVHWRYMPDFSNVDWDGVVDEYFAIAPGGAVLRTVRVGTEKLADWNDRANATVQTLRLRGDGIEEISRKEAVLTEADGDAVEGSPVRTRGVGNPVVWFKFDDGLRPNRDLTREGIRGATCEVAGHKTVWKKGVSGTALAFDGYYSGVALPAERAPKLTEALTVEAWVALGAYPFEWAPIVHQAEWGKSGYYLGVDRDGRIGLHIAVDGKWQTVRHSESLDLFRWYHVVGVFNGKAGKVELYLDGELCASKEVPEANIQLADKDLIVGLNSERMPVADGRVRRGKWPSMCGIDGLIDEVRIYPDALSEREVACSFKSFEPTVELRENPDMEERHFPAHPKNTPAEKFGAQYTKLKYYQTWDNMWRVSDHPDIVVGFDELPVRIVCWRGLSYGPALATENGKWVGDQSSENYRQIEEPGEAEGCCEHMSDKQCRHSHVRLIENTDARVVVHWRYGLVDSRYKFVPANGGAGDWADEYWTVYPDGVAIRHLARGKIWYDSWVETMFFSEPGTTPEDNVELQAYTLVNMNGESETYSWEDGSPECDLEDPIIAMVNAKSVYKTFNVYPTGSSVKTFDGHSRNSHFHWWNHWPAAQITSDGRGARAPDRAAHSSLVWGFPSRDYLMYGLTDKAATALLPLAKSWNSPPYITNTKGCSSLGYKQKERAYHMAALSGKMDFLISGSERNPIVNPCFVIENWGSDDKARLEINGETVRTGKRFRQGIVRDTDGKQMLVVWIKAESEKPMEVSISEVGG